MYVLLALQDKVIERLVLIQSFLNEDIFYLTRGIKLQIQTTHSFDSCCHIHSKQNFQIPTFIQDNYPSKLPIFKQF